MSSIRKLYRIADGYQLGQYPDPDDDTESDRVELEYANDDRAALVSSESACAELPDVHFPVLDIDFPCRLVESETPGHHHLFIDKAVTWDAYVGVLAALAAAGIIEPGYANASIARGATFVALKPWKNKGGDGDRTEA